MKTAGLLLAAGASLRFGDEDKLLVPIKERPMVSYAADVMRAVDPDYKIAVVSNPKVQAELTDFMCVCARDGLQSGSLRAAVLAAQMHGVDRILIMLADMPFVTLNTVHRVFDAYCEGHASASIYGDRRGPPACFSRRFFGEIISQSGDQGARSILKNLPLDALVSLPQEEAIDIDTYEDWLAHKA
jgi:CTP:molybdopterin cytidylyltransferase MocA